MNTPLFIARRYLFSRKKKTVINVISWISLVGIAVGTTALIVVLSVYNGIGETTQNLFNVFDPELIIEPAAGKTFHTDSINYPQLCQTPGVAGMSQIVEENAWITHKSNEAIVQLRGVDSSYGPLCGLDTLIHDGSYALRMRAPDEYGDIQTIPLVLFGSEIYANLGLDSYTNSPVAIHIPRRGSSIGMSMLEAFNTCYAYPAGTFYIQQEIDARYVVTHIDCVRTLMDYAPDEVTAIAVTLDPKHKTQQVKEHLAKTLGSQFTVKDRFDQQPLYFKVFRSERLGVFLILSLIVLIATLNLIASLSLLIIDKRKDIRTLRSLGMEPRQIKRTFLTEGIMISLVGVVAGLVIGFAVCFLQQHFGIIKMGSNFVVSAFPVAMRAVDFMATFLMVSLLSVLSVCFTIWKAKI